MVALVALLTVACGDSDDEPPAAEVSLSTSPEFVNRLIPGVRPLALVSVEQAPGPVVLEGTASLPGAIVTFQPAAPGPGEVAEVWLEVAAATAETEVVVTVTGTSGTAADQVSIRATVVPGFDDLEPMALQIAEVFLDELSDDVAELPSSLAMFMGGTPVAGLLVVSHYAWFTEEAEIGLAWHIMVAPDDWAELYVRPRDQLTPTRAFRLDSWSTALSGGTFEVTEIDPPAAVTR